MTNDPGGIIGFLMEHNPELYIVLWSMDKACDGMLFGDPNHTISWHVAMMAKAGNPFGILCCDALNALSPNHCAWALGGNPIGGP